MSELASALAKLERGTVWVPITDEEAAALLADRARKDEIVNAASVLTQGPLRLLLKIYHEQNAEDALASIRAQEQYDELCSALAGHYV